MHSKIYPQGPFTPHPDNVDTSCRDKEGWMGVMERIRMRRSPGLTILIRYPLPLIFCHHHLSLLSSSSSNIIRRTLVPIFCLYLSGKKGGGGESATISSLFSFGVKRGLSILYCLSLTNNIRLHSSQCIRRNHHICKGDARRQ